MTLQLRSLIQTLLIGMCLIGFSTTATYAQDDPLAPTQPPKKVCTTDEDYKVPENMQIITDVVDNITCILYGPASNLQCSNSKGIGQMMFEKTVEDDGFKNTIIAVMSLLLVIFAISFMLGMIQMTMVEFVMLAFKMSVICFLVTSFPWTMFFEIFGVFFLKGTNWFISVATQIALGTVPGLDTSKPFQLIDYTIATALSPKMVVTVLAMFYTGPYGLLFGILTVMGLGTLVSALLQAMWIFLMSMIVRAFLFGVAPIFIAFYPFQRTRYLFDGWLNQLVNTMLQPALLFIFFAFFSTLIQSAMNNILRIPVCYVSNAALFTGAPNANNIPQFSVEGVPETTRWGFTGPMGQPGAGTPFPIDIMDVLVFLLLVQLCLRFNGVALNIARELSGASVSLNMQGMLSNMVNPSRKFAGDLMNNSESAIKNMTSRGVNLKGVVNNPTVKRVQQMAKDRAALLTGGRNQPGGNP